MTDDLILIFLNLGANGVDVRIRTENIISYPLNVAFDSSVLSVGFLSNSKVF